MTRQPHFRFRVLAIVLIVVLLSFSTLIEVARADTVTGSITSGDPTQTNRIFRDTIPGACGSLKGFPGLFGASGINYDQYSITNTGTSPACVTVTLTTSCPGGIVHLVAYNGSFTPGNVSTNYLADSGSSAIDGAPVGLGFDLQPGQTAIIVAHHIELGVRCSAYSLTSNLPFDQGIQGGAPQFFNPGDRRVDPRPGDRIAVYCQEPGTVYVIVIGNDGHGKGHVRFVLEKLIAAGNSGLSAQAVNINNDKFDNLGKVSVQAKRSNGTLYFYVAWNGGKYGATGQGDFSKAFSSPITFCAFK